MPILIQTRPLLAMLFAFVGVGAAHLAVAATGIISVAADNRSVKQSAGTVVIYVLRSGGSTGAANAAFRTQNGTAEAGVNYVGQSGLLTWSAGDASQKPIAVKLVGAAFSGTKTFTVAVYTSHGAILGSSATTTVTVIGSIATSPAPGSGPAAKLSAKLGKPAQFLLGVGGQGSLNTVSLLESQAAKIDIYSMYLVSGDWTSWNSAPCDYVCVVADAADSLGAIPMYTQYQMANDGDGNISVINNSAFMTTYWARARQLFKDLGAYDKPALVNLEPDFWGYAEKAAPDANPTKLSALVSSNADCTALPNNVTGVAGCLIAMARKYAPKAYVGFPPSNWGASTTAQVVAFMNAVGAQKADFIVEQTSDRDAGCFEITPQPSDCVRTGPVWYWDETNETHPNFLDHLAEATAYHTGIGNLPLIWWQTPEGVPSTTRGGSIHHYRDNRMHYFLTHPAQLVAAGGLGVVFSTGDNNQTNISTDAGQFQLLDSDYFRAPSKLP